MNLMSLCDYPWWLWTLLPFVLGLALAALLWRHFKDKYHKAQSELTSLKRKYASTEEVLILSRKKKGELEGLLAISEGKQHQLERQVAKQSANLVSSIGMTAPLVEEIVESKIEENEEEVQETIESQPEIESPSQIESQAEELEEMSQEVVEAQPEELEEISPEVNEEQPQEPTELLPEPIVETEQLVEVGQEYEGIDVEVPIGAAISSAAVSTLIPEVENVDESLQKIEVEVEIPESTEQGPGPEEEPEALEELDEPAIIASAGNSEDDYLDCKEYENRAVTNDVNNIALFQHENEKFYYAVYYSNGTVRLRSEGFDDMEMRDQNVSQVVSGVNNREMYRKIQKGKYYIDVLYNSEGIEIGRSCLKKEFIPFTAAKAATVVVGATSIVATDSKESTPSEIISTYPKPILSNRKYDALGIESLKVIEGIGPKMESILNDNGIDSLGELAESSDIRIEAILSQFGARYQMMDTSQWIGQAKLAAEGNWEELINMQKGIGGKLGKPTDSKVEKMMIKKGLIRQWKENDLKAIEGVGPKIAQLLIKNKIYNWSDLSNTPVAALQSILDTAGKSYMLADPSTWPEQASMASEGKFDELEKFQDQLK